MTSLPGALQVSNVELLRGFHHCGLQVGKRHLLKEETLALDRQLPLHFSPHLAVQGNGEWPMHKERFRERRGCLRYQGIDKRPGQPAVHLSSELRLGAKRHLALMQGEMRFWRLHG